LQSRHGRIVEVLPLNMMGMVVRKNPLQNRENIPQANHRGLKIKLPLIVGELSADYL
jgi:hypothetical protein